MQKFRHIFPGFIIVICIILVAPGNICLAQIEKGNLSNENCFSCHTGIKQPFEKSVHQNNSCLDCHANITSEHLLGVRNTILPGTSKSAEQNCQNCHSMQSATYQESFHGRALLLGSKKTATCSSCHGEHEVLKTTDPRSMVASINLPTTCGKCHVDKVDNFAIGTEHKLLDAQGPGAPQYWTLKFFVWLTILTVIGLILHMELELLHLYKKVRSRN